MKKLLILAIVLAFVSVSCSTQQNPEVFGTIPVHVKKDTIVINHENQTVPRYACGSGQRLKHDALVGIKNVPIPIGIDTTIFINIDSVVALYATPVTQQKAVAATAGIPDWYSKLCWILLAIIAIASTLWLLLHLLKNVRKNTSNSGGSSTRVLANNSYGKTENGRDAIVNDQFSNNAQRSTRTSQIDTEDYQGLKNLVQQLQQSPAGGSVKLGDLQIDIPKTITDITIYADRGGKVHDISIVVDSMSLNADMIDIHEGDDHRSYNRNTKKDEQREQ